jgi:hypothetical protein
MGYLLSFSVLKGTPSTAALHQLPKSLPWKLYRSRKAGVMMLDVFNVKRDGEHPFSSIPAIQDLPLEFADPLRGLNELYESLRKKNRANGFKRAFVNLNLTVSRLTSAETLSVLSDDEGLDLACTSNQGALHALRFGTGRVEIGWHPGRAATELKRRTSQIHKIVEEECTAFVGMRLPIYGFDGDVNLLELDLVDRSPPLPPPSPKPPRGGWAAHERQQRELAQARRKWWEFWRFR